VSECECGAPDATFRSKLRGKLSTIKSVKCTSTSTDNASVHFFFAKNVQI
jgi:hypothetical protein